MQKIDSYLDSANLIKILNQAYPLGFTNIRLHREMIGHVYFAETGTGKYVLKLYRPYNSHQALQSIEIIQFLRTHDYPAVPIIPTKDGSLSITLAGPKGDCTGILYAYIHGKEPNLETEITNLALQTGELHSIMKNHPMPLVRRGKEFYIDRFIDMLAQLQYPPEKVNELADYGNELWGRMEKLPRGFCHGDLHSGNILQTQSRYFLFDSI